MDSGKLDEYFKTLEDHVYNNMKNELMSDKEYVNHYDSLLSEFKTMKETHN